MPFIRRTPLAVILLALCAASPRLHAATATTTMSQVSFKLIDLDLTDGITPSLQFLSADPIYLEAWSSWIGGQSAHVNFGSTQQVTAGIGESFATASVLAGDPFSPTSTFGLSSSVGLPDQASPEFRSYADSGIVVAPIRLSAHTRLEITAQATANVSVPTDWTGTSQAAIQVWGMWTESSHAEYVKQNEDGTIHEIGNPSLSISWDNLLSSADDKQLLIFQSSNVQAPAAPVPEAATGWMMACGLALLGWQLARRPRSN